LGRLVPAFRRHALDGVKARLQELLGARTAESARSFIRLRLADMAVRVPVGIAFDGERERLRWRP